MASLSLLDIISQGNINHCIHMLSLYSPFTFLLLLSCFLAGSERCVFTGEGEEWPASPLLHGVAGWGVTRLASLPRGGAAIHFVLYCKTDFIQCNSKHYYICNSCSCNFSPGQYVSQDSCNKLIKGDPFFFNS